MLVDKIKNIVPEAEIDERYPYRDGRARQVQETGSPAKGRPGSVFRLHDLHDGNGLGELVRRDQPAIRLTNINYFKDVHDQPGKPGTAHRFRHLGHGQLERT